MLNTDLTAEQREYQNIVKSSADSLLSILNDILDFSKIEAGKLELEHLPFDLQETLGTTLHTLASRAAAKGLELAVRIPPDVPNELVGDAGRLRQIIVNLVGNAIKFTSRGEIVVEVEPESVDAHRGSPRISPCAIPASASRRKNKPRFSRRSARPTPRRRASMAAPGLGLAITSQLVQMMGGRVWVESQPAKEARFISPHVFRERPSHVRPSRPRSKRCTTCPCSSSTTMHTNRLICQELINNWGMKSTVSGKRTGGAGCACGARRHPATVSTRAAGCHDAGHGWL